MRLAILHLLRKIADRSARSTCARQVDAQRTDEGRPDLTGHCFFPQTPHHRLRRSCLAQVDLVLRSAILHRKCKIAKHMCAQKPHRGYLHNAHIRPEGEALRSCALCYQLCEKRLHLLCLFVAANFAFRTLRKRKAQCCAVAVLAAPR